MPSLAINTSPDATLKVCRALYKTPEEMVTDGGLGADDFIFGGAAAWFGDCELIIFFHIFDTILTKDSGTIACNGGGSITANNRESTTAWYVFDTSTITAAPGWTTTGENYLGRPWGVDARVIYQYCSLSDVINAAGWTTLAADATP